MSRSYAYLGALVLAGCASTAPAPAAQPREAMHSPTEVDPMRAARGDKLICRWERPTGSNVPEQVCRWASNVDAGQARAQEMQRGKGTVQQRKGD